MAYKKQTWVDHFVGPDGTVVRQGTAMDALHFNHMEEGIGAAGDHADNKENPHQVTPAQLGFGMVWKLDEEGYLCYEPITDRAG